MGRDDRRRFVKRTGSVLAGASLFATAGASGTADDGRDDERTDRGERNESSSEGPSLPRSDAAEDWASYVADGGNTHSVDHEPDFACGDLEVAWTYEHDESLRIGHSPVVSGGTVYLPFGFDGGTIHALDAADGTLEWTATELGSILTPTVTYNTVFVGGDTLTAINAANGDVRWQREFEARVSTPTVQYRRVYAVIDGIMYAFDVQTGTLDWAYDPGPYHWSSHVDCREEPAQCYQSPVWGGPVPVADETVYGAAGHLTFALDARTGEECWRTTSGWAYYGDPSMVIDNILVESAQHASVVRDATTGEQLYRTGSYAPITAADEDHAYVRADHSFGAYDLDTGENRWGHGDHYYGSVGDPIVTAETVLVPFGEQQSYNPGHRSNALVAFDRETGREKWVFSLDRDDLRFGSADVIVSGETIYATVGNQLVALRAETGGENPGSERK